MTKREKEIERVILLNCIFDEEKRRTKTEQEAERLHIAGHPDRAAKVLNELDDSIIIELRERLKKLDEEPVKNDEEPAAEAEGVDPETRARILRLCEKDPRITHGNLIFEQDVKAREMTKKAITTLFEMEPLTVEKAVLILEDAADILKEAAAKFSETAKVFREERTLHYKKKDGLRRFGFANKFNIVMQADRIHSEKATEELRKLLDETTQKAKEIIAADY